MSDDGLERAHLEAWLGPRLPGAPAVRVTEIDRPSGGFSAETLLLTVECDRNGVTDSERFVLRRETDDPAVYPQQADGLDVEVDIQHRVMQAVAASSSVPLAPLVGYEADPSVLGAPFFVMGFVDGDVPRENPLYTQSGFFVDATPDERAQLVEDGLRVLAELHTIEWRSAGLEWLVDDGVEPGTAHQLDVWDEFAQRELEGRVHPGLGEAFAWMRSNLPADERIGLCWGDPRPGNIIWRDFRAVCATDFEAASVASPDQDLGWWLMFDRWSHESFGAERLPGEPDRDEQRCMYAEFAGRPVPDTTFHEVFAAARYAAIVVRVMNRSVLRGDMPADQTIWLENPAATCLDQLLAEI